MSQMPKVYMYPAHDIDEYKVITEAGLKVFRTGRSGLLEINKILHESDLAAAMMNRIGLSVEIDTPNPDGKGGWDSTKEDVEMQWRSKYDTIEEIKQYILQESTPEGMRPIGDYNKIEKVVGNCFHALCENIPLIIAGASCRNVFSEILVIPERYEDVQYPFVTLQELAADCMPENQRFELIMLKYGGHSHKMWGDWILD